MAISYKHHAFAGDLASALQLRFRSPGMRLICAAVTLMTAIAMISCGSTAYQDGGSTPTPPPPAAITVSLSPAAASLETNGSQQFSATVTNTSNTAVTWSATGGTITSTGLYTAPGLAGTFTVRATSVADASKSGQATVTVSAGPPPPPNSVSSITMDGITWTFNAPVPAGRFVNGDWYVVGPVTVTSISPVPTRTAPFRNGSVINLPRFDDESGFDDRTGGNRFDSSMRVYPPLDLRPGDTLVSSISVATLGTLPRVMRSTDPSGSPVRTVSVLTVLGAPVDVDAFRPSYCDRAQTIYHARNVNRQLLPSLARPASTPTLAESEGYFRRPWIDLSHFAFDVPVEYMPDYGREIGFAVSYASLLLMVDFPADQKVPLTNYMVQYGIDLFGCLEAGFPGWSAHGGHGNGRKLPIVLAGVLLDEPRMKQVSALHQDIFGEDMQTLYVTDTPPAGTFNLAWQGATVVYGGHLGTRGSGSSGTGPYEHLQPRNWVNSDGEDYRRCCTSNSWVGQALVMRLLRAESFWNHPAFFDYVDRWMTEDDSAHVVEIRNQSGFDYSANWLRQRQTRFILQGNHPRHTFIDDMWNAHRSSVP